MRHAATRIAPARMLAKLLAVLLLAAVPLAAAEPELESLPADPYFADYRLLKVAPVEGAVLKPGDRLAICGDSITELRMYSRIIETYLTVCAPQLNVTVRQHGWMGEKSPEFLARMDNDVLRFHPTIATTCYGMNDHGYQAYKDEFGHRYRDTSREIIRKFKADGARVIMGSPGTVSDMSSWWANPPGTIQEMNASLAEFRNLGVRLAEEEQIGFADIFLPMLVQGVEARQKYGGKYGLTREDGVHPGWAGQLIMAHVFLHAMGVDGNVAGINLDMTAGKATASAGHRVVSATSNEIVLESSRYPYCATGKPDSDLSVRSGMTLVPFNETLNRFMLVVTNAPAPRLRVTWGENSRVYSAPELSKGINLAADFELNPFMESFERVDNAVAEKQAYETRQVKELMHGPEGRADMEATVALTEKTRVTLVQAICSAITPVTHTIRIEADEAVAIRVDASVVRGKAAGIADMLGQQQQSFFTKFDRRVTCVRDVLGARRIDFTVMILPRVLAPATVTAASSVWVESAP